MRNVKRTANQLQHRINKVRELHPDWTDEQVEQMAMDNMLGLGKIE